MSEMYICKRCNLPKPFPAEFITSYLKAKTGNTCKDCRKILSRETRRRLLGYSEKGSCWKSSNNRWNSRLFAKKPDCED